MSWQRAILNRWLRLTEKPHLARAKDPAALRRSFEIKARLFFHGPRGVSRDWAELGLGEALWLRPKGAAAGKVLLYFHGGGYVFGSPRTHAAMIAVLTKQLGVVAVLPRYPLAPEHIFPAPVDRAEGAYRALLAQGYAARDIVMGGDSAGGGLALALLARLIVKGAEVPGGVFAFSPLTDMTYSGETIRTNAASDVVLPASRVDEMAQMYLADQDATQPEASPLFAEFIGAPPVWITVGDTEILLDDSRRMVSRLEAAGVSVTFQLEQDLPHVWPIFHTILPEGRQTLEALAGWIKPLLFRAGDS